MIKGILFAVFFVLLAASVGAAIFMFIKWSQSESDNEYDNDLKKLERSYENALDRAWDSSEKKKQIKAEYEAKKEEYIRTHKRPQPAGRRGFLASCIAATALLIGVICIPGSFHQVETGEVAVVRQMGKIVGIRHPGTYFDFYMLNKYEYYDTKVQQDKITTASYSKDGQTMDLEIFLQYQVQSENIEKIATEYGNLDALQARIETVAIEKTKAVMSSAEAMVIVQDRAKYSNDVSETVRAGISDDYYVNVKDVVLTNIDFTDEFEKSVENKVIAEQDKQATITKADAERQAAETKANADAEVARVKAEADRAVAEIEAQKKEIEANADKKVAEIAAEAEATVKKTLAVAEAKAATEKILTLAKTLGYEVSETTEGSGEYKINLTTGPGAHVSTTEHETVNNVFDSLVKDYLEYLAYLEQWNGELPQVVSGDDVISIIVPND